MKNIKIQNKVFLFLIILLGFILRIYNISSAPPSLNWDEVSHGYNAYSILKTGRDEWGQFLPLTNFRAYGDYPLPLNLYLTIPSILFLGLSEFSIRFPHVLMGTLTILATYFLTYGVTRKRSISLLASLLFAVEPWSLFSSRFVVQSNPATLFLISAGALFVNRDKHKYFLPLSFTAFLTTLFSYHATRIFTPIFLLFIVRKEILSALRVDKIVRVLSVAILALVMITTQIVLLSKDAQARARWLFLIDDTAVSRIIEKRNESQLPEFATRLLYNRPTYFLKEFTKNYLGYFSPRFLFINGGTQYQFSVPNHGILYLANLPFFYLGLGILLMKSLKSKSYRFLLLWLILSPIPASITNEKFAVIRATTMLPIPMILSALGLISSVNWLKQFKLLETKYKIIYVIYFVFLAGFVENYLNIYFNDYKKAFSWSWQYGYKEVFNYAKENYSKYDKIVITKKYGEPHEFLLFFWPWDPAKYRNDSNLIRFNQSNWFWVDRFDKFYFVNDWNIPKEEWQSFVLESGMEFNCENQKCLLITSPDNYPKRWNKLETINYLDGKPAFEIYEN